MTKRALGKGLSALLGESPGATRPRESRHSTDGSAREEAESSAPLLDGREAVMVDVAGLAPNPHQPRKSIDDNSLQGLSESIRQNGVLQPVLVRRRNDRYELVAGERRLRAAKLAGLDEIPALVCTMEEAESMKVALLENIQRENLNAIEEAEAYRAIMEHYGATHQELAAMLGRSRSAVSNLLRLLNLETSIQNQVVEGTLTMGHARALLGVEDGPTRLRLAREVEKNGLSVRALEERVQGNGGSAPHRRRRKAEKPDPEAAAIREFETRLQHHLGSPSRIRRRGEKGRIEIEFYSNEELERVLESMGIDPQL